MRRAMAEIQKMTQEKADSQRTVDKFVTDELLEMGLSYSNTGTHYLHDSIVTAVALRLEDFNSVNDFCYRIGEEVQKKYNIGARCYNSSILHTIERAFETGNINYLLETFKSCYDRDRMKVSKNTFIMTVRKKITEASEEQNAYNANQLRIIIQGELEGITDMSVLEGMCKIVLSPKERTVIQ